MLANEDIRHTWIIIVCWKVENKCKRTENKKIKIEKMNEWIAWTFHHMQHSEK